MNKFEKLIVSLLLIAPLAFAGPPKTFEWTPPTQNTDGTPLADNEIASYNIYCNQVVLGNVPNTGGTDSWTSPPLPTGDYTCSATCIAVNGEESANSNTINFTIDPSMPGSPNNFSITLP